MMSVYVRYCCSCVSYKIPSAGDLSHMTNVQNDFVQVVWGYKCSLFLSGIYFFMLLVPKISM